MHEDGAAGIVHRTCARSQLNVTSTHGTNALGKALKVCARVKPDHVGAQKAIEQCRTMRQRGEPRLLGKGRVQEEADAYLRMASTE